MARNVEAGRAFIRVSIKENLAGLKNISNKMKTWGSSLTGLGTKMTALGAGMAAPFIGAIKAASDMEETMSKFSVVFGESAGEVKAWSDQFAGAVGRSKQQAASFMAASQDLFVPLGFASDAATDLSKQVTALAVDLGSFNNMADEDVIRDLHAALTGSGEVMKKYGVIVSEAAVKQELLNQKIDPKKATDQQKVQARLNLIMKGTTAAQGDAIRTAGGFANQMKALQGNLMDTAVAIGSALLPVITPLVTKASEIIKLVADWVSNNTGLIKTVFMVAAGVAGVGVAVVALGGIMSAAGAAIGVVVSVLTGMGAIIGVILSPIGLLVAAIAGGTAAFLSWTETGQGVVAFLQEQFGAMLGFVQGVIGGISDAFKAGDMQLAAQIAWAGVIVAWEEAKQALMGSWNALANGWDEFWTGMASVVDGVVTTIRSAWASAVGWIAQSLLKVWGLIEKALSAVGLLNETTDIGGAVRAVADQTASDKAGLAAARNARDLERGAGLSARKAERESGASEGLTAARDELASLIAEASKKATEAAAAAPAASKPTTPAEVKAAVQDVGGMMPGISGTFSAAAAGVAFAGPSTDDLAKQTAENTKQSARSLKKLERFEFNGPGAFA
ncbi:MAG: phage tail tape measure protein [Pirellulaceae bacterium]